MVQIGGTDGCKDGWYRWVVQGLVYIAVQMIGIESNTVVLYRGWYRHVVHMVGIDVWYIWLV